MIKQAQLIGGAVIAIAVMAIVLNQFLGLAIVAGDSGTETNESVTVDYGNVTAVSVNADNYDSSVTVYNSSDGELVDGTDYTWHPGNGTIGWFNTSDTTDGEQASVTYSWSNNAPGPMASVFTTLENIGTAAFTLLVVGLLLIAARAIMQFFGGGF